MSCHVRCSFNHAWVGIIFVDIYQCTSYREFLNWLLFKKFKMMLIKLWSSRFFILFKFTSLFKLSPTLLWRLRAIYKQNCCMLKFYHVQNQIVHLLVLNTLQFRSQGYYYSRNQHFCVDNMSYHWYGHNYKLTTYKTLHFRNTFWLIVYSQENLWL